VVRRRAERQKSVVWESGRVVQRRRRAQRPRLDGGRRGTDSESWFSGSSLSFFARGLLQNEELDLASIRSLLRPEAPPPHDDAGSPALDVCERACGPHSVALSSAATARSTATAHASHSGRRLLKVARRNNLVERKRKLRKEGGQRKKRRVVPLCRGKTADRR
jgi:hypothetical protein